MEKLKTWGATPYFALLGVLMAGCYPSDSNNYEYGVLPIHTYSAYCRVLDSIPEAELVPVESILTSPILDVRYATRNNFTGEVIYATAEVWLAQSAAEALEKVERELNNHGYGLILFDGYRPYSATVKFYEIYKDTTFVASPYNGSRHNRGCAVDLSLYHLETGRAVEMPTEYDDFTNRAHPNAELADSVVLFHRNLLRSSMESHGFSVYPYEWWHFDFLGWEAYPLLDLSFEDLRDNPCAS